MQKGFPSLSGEGNRKDSVHYDMPIMVETRQPFGPGDFRSVGIVCHCGGQVAFSLSAQFPSHSPCFNKGWQRDEMKDERLLVDIADKIVQRKDEPGARLMVEIAAPERG